MTLEEFKVSADFKWDLANKKIYEDVTVNSGDVNGRKMRVQVVDGKLIRDLTGYTLNLGWKNLKDPTAKGLDAFKVVDITKGIFEIPYTTAMLSNVGRLIAALQLVGIDDVVESNNFLITVRNSNIDADAIQTESSFTALTEALVTVNQLNAEFDDAMLSWGGEFDSTLAGWTSTLSATNDNFVRISTDAEVAYIAQSAGFNATFDGALAEWDQTVDTKVDEYEVIASNLESTYAPELLSVKQQLEQTLNKSAITLTHMFADNTARDAYFVANPTELVEQLFVKVGTGYQQYLEGAWQASAAIVTEQLSATNQPIIDTGNYFTADNTNEALQELGAHKASTANPHGVTKSQVGLGNVDNTSDANKPISTAGQTALNLKANKVQEAWITPTLLNGWTEASGYPVRYMKDEMGFVHVKGAVSNASVTLPSAAFSFVLNYRPNQTIGLPLQSNNQALSICYITTLGSVVISGTAKTYIFLDGITFRAEG